MNTQYFFLKDTHWNSASTTGTVKDLNQGNRQKDSPKVMVAPELSELLPSWSENHKDKLYCYRACHIAVCCNPFE